MLVTFCTWPSVPQRMEAIAKQLIYHMDTTRSSKVNYLVVDREHLYDADIQKVLFPIVQ